MRQFSHEGVSPSPPVTKRVREIEREFVQQYGVTIPQSGYAQRGAWRAGFEAGFEGLDADACPYNLDGLGRGSSDFINQHRRWWIAGHTQGRERASHIRGN